MAHRLSVPDAPRSSAGAAFVSAGPGSRTPSPARTRSRTGTLIGHLPALDRLARAHSAEACTLDWMGTPRRPLVVCRPTDDSPEAAFTSEVRICDVAGTSPSRRGTEDARSRYRGRLTAGERAVALHDAHPGKPSREPHAPARGAEPGQLRAAARLRLLSRCTHHARVANDAWTGRLGQLFI